MLFIHVLFDAVFVASVRATFYRHLCSFIKFIIIYASNQSKRTNVLLLVFLAVIASNPDHFSRDIFSVTFRKTYVLTSLQISQIINYFALKQDHSRTLKKPEDVMDGEDGKDIILHNTKISKEVKHHGSSLGISTTDGHS
jgi:hypothetical protein